MVFLHAPAAGASERDCRRAAATEASGAAAEPSRQHRSRSHWGRQRSLRNGYPRRGVQGQWREVRAPAASARHTWRRAQPRCRRRPSPGTSCAPCALASLRMAQSTSTGAASRHELWPCPLRRAHASGATRTNRQFRAARTSGGGYRSILQPGAGTRSVAEPAAALPDAAGPGGGGTAKHDPPTQVKTHRLRKLTDSDEALEKSGRMISGRGFCRYTPAAGPAAASQAAGACRRCPLRWCIGCGAGLCVARRRVRVLRWGSRCRAPCGPGTIYTVSNQVAQHTTCD